jgi:hypothetical protein
MTSLSAGDVAPPKFAVPAYTAVMESVPAGRLVVVSVAVLLTPPPGVRVPLPSEVVPLMNVTEPLGAALPLLVIVAVKVTAWPTLAGFTEDATVAVEAGGLTTWLNTADVAAPLLPFPA